MLDSMAPLREIRQKPCGSQSPKYLLFGSLHNKFATPWPSPASLYDGETDPYMVTHDHTAIHGRV